MYMYSYQNSHYPSQFRRSCTCTCTYTCILTRTPITHPSLGGVLDLFDFDLRQHCHHFLLPVPSSPFPSSPLLSISSCKWDYIYYLYYQMTITYICMTITWLISISSCEWNVQYIYYHMTIR